MIARVSSAAGLSRRGRSANCARSIASAYSRRVRNCHPCAISISSTPWSSAAYASRISRRAVRTAVSPACGSRVSRSSTVSGRDAANSAASSSRARGLTLDQDRLEGSGLPELERPALGELQQGDEGGEHVHDGRPFADHVEPLELLALGEQRLDPRRGALHIERPGHDAVQHRLGDERDHPFRRREQVVQLDHEGHGGGRRGRGLGSEAAPELLGAPGGGLTQPVHELANLLILEQPAHQPRRHLEVVRRLVQPQLVDDREKLVGDLRDREVGDVDLVLADQVQQQVERAGELLQLDDESVLVAGGERGIRHWGKAPSDTPNRPTTLSAPCISSWAGQRYTACAAGTSFTNRRNATMGRYPIAYSCRYLSPAPGGRTYLKTWLPSSGGIGSRLKNASQTFISIP